MIKSTVPRFHEPKAISQARPVKAEPQKTTTTTKSIPQNSVKKIAAPTQSRVPTATTQTRPKSGMKAKEEAKVQSCDKENIRPPTTGLFTNKPSAKLDNFKKTDPFASKNNMKTYDIFLLVFLNRLSSGTLLSTSIMLEVFLVGLIMDQSTTDLSGTAESTLKVLLLCS